MRETVSRMAAVVCLTVCASLRAVDGAEFAVPRGGSIAEAVEKSRSMHGPKTVVLSEGDWFLEEPIELDARDSGLTLRGAGMGKTRLWGGRRLMGWKMDGEDFWSVDLPEVKDGVWNFRSLVVDGELAERARFPGGTNRLENLGTWDFPLLPATSGFWARKPTFAELVTMPYKPEDLPDTMDFRNAEIRLYHMWSESLRCVASNDLARHVVYLSEPADWPMGARGKRGYEVCNTREGMTKPGQWYLDKTRGKIVYWPKPGQNMATTLIVAPRLETVVRVGDRKKASVRGVALSDFSVQATTPSDGPAGFSGVNLSSAVQFANAVDCVATRLRICNVGGSGIRMDGRGCRVEICDIHHAGARAIGSYGTENHIVSNRIRHVGLQYPSACALGVGGAKGVVRRNDIFDVPYSGIVGSGTDMLFEDNRVRRAMHTLHDGAAIYGSGLIRGVMSGNVVRDIGASPDGYGASSFYCDEGSVGCVIKRNKSHGVPRPVNAHMTRGTELAGNAFAADGDMQIDFMGSIGCVVTDNVFVVGGTVKPSFSQAVKTWERNRVFRSGPDGKADRTEVTCPLPAPRVEKPRGPFAAERTAVRPDIDGVFASAEWKGAIERLDRGPDGVLVGGALSHLRTSWDGGNLYVGVQVANFCTAEISQGAVWGADDGVEISVAGVTLRAFACGRTTLAGVGSGEVNVCARMNDDRKPWNPKVLTVEAAIPFAALGIRPEPGLELPFNVRVHGSEFDEWRQWEAEGRSATVRLEDKGGDR